MRKHILVFLLLGTLSAHAVERVSLDSLQAHWGRYLNKTVEITTPLVVCGNFYDSLILAPERLVCPEERAVGLADGDSTQYEILRAHNHEASVVLHCRNRYYNVRTSDVVHGLKARVTSERQLLTGKSVMTRHLQKDRLARPRKGTMRIVGANIENYFADLGGYAHKRTTPAQLAVKTKKLSSALRSMHADIFALCEMQVGGKAPSMLVAALNKGGKRYAYVSLDMPDADRIGGCFIYNTERVRPCGDWLSAYSDTTSHYRARMYALPFEDTVTGERFIISLNHFKSKRPGRTQYDTNMRRMQNTDSLLAMLPKAVEFFGDEDVLLLGDFNCYTQEQPIQTIVRAGFADMLPHGRSGNYSYTYKGETGYLDRCFASPSMARQIVSVRPWHINADWYYSHGAYKMKDKTKHRYADHDPIIVDVKLMNNE